MTPTEMRAGLTRHIDTVTSVLFVVAWSSGFIGARLGTDVAPVATVLAWRFMLLAALLVIVAGFAGVRPSLGAIRRQGALALTNQVVYLGLIFTGTEAGARPGIMALIAATQPMIVAVAAAPLLGERTSVHQRIGLVIGLAGVALVVGGDAFTGASAPWWAYVLPFVGVVSLSAGTIADRRWHGPEGLLETQVVQAVTSAVAFTLIALSAGQFVPPADPAFWGAVAWLICFASLGGYGLFVLTARRQGATRASTLMYLTPPATMVWAFLMFRDSITWLGLAGLLVSAVGVWLVLRRRPALAGPVDTPVATEADASAGSSAEAHSSLSAELPAPR